MSGAAKSSKTIRPAQMRGGRKGVLVLLAVALLTASGCANARHRFGRSFETATYQIGKTTRTDILEAMGPPQLYDFTRAGEVGSNYLVYEFRATNTWLFTPFIVNYGINTERTKTAAFYFDAGGVLTAVGLSENQPTTRRSAFWILFPWGLEEVVK